MPASRPAGKSAAAFRTISEVSDELDVPQHVLRFWEGKFSQGRPLKRGGGRRYYRPEDIDLLRRIRDLLYSEGYTIKGVQRSEEHTSELQSLMRISYAVFCLKKKNRNRIHTHHDSQLRPFSL